MLECSVTLAAAPSTLRHADRDASARLDLHTHTHTSQGGPHQMRTSSCTPNENIILYIGARALRLPVRAHCRRLPLLNREASRERGRERAPERGGGASDSLTQQVHQPHNRDCQSPSASPSARRSRPSRLATQQTSPTQKCPTRAPPSRRRRRSQVGMPLTQRGSPAVKTEPNTCEQFAIIEAIKPMSDRKRRGQETHIDIRPSRDDLMPRSNRHPPRQPIVGCNRHGGRAIVPSARAFEPRSQV